MIELRTLGTFDVRSGEGRDIHSLATQPKRLALFAYLALAGSNRFHRRDTVVSVFWPQLDQPHARGALRQSLRFLRRALGDAPIVARGEEEIGIDPTAVWVDAQQFEQACHAGRTEEALVHFQHAAAFVPDEPSYQLSLGTIHRRLGGAARPHPR